MNPETITKLQEVFAPIADKIGQGAGYGWEVVLRQQVAKGITYSVEGIFFLLVSSYLLSKTGTIFSFLKQEDAEPAILFVSISVLIGFIFGIGLLESGIFHLYNPAYYAIDFFIHLAK